MTAPQPGDAPPQPVVAASKTRLDPPFAPRDLLLAAGLTLLAAIIRWPMLQLVPRYTDEWENVQLALKIARGAALPAVSPADLYNGPLFEYLLALGFLAGGSVDWPRTFVWLVGSLTVGLTYFLGVGLYLCQARPGDDRSHLALAARCAGALAALLLAVAFIPVVINSHIAWSNSTTPFWTTLFLLALVETHRRGRPAGLVLAGGLAGLAQQTHPSVIVISVGGALWILWSRPGWLRTRWPWLGLALAALMAGNLIGYNLWTGGGSVADAAVSAEGFTAGATGQGYLANLAGFARMAYQLIASTFLATINETAEPAELSAALGNPGAVLYGLVALAGLAYTARRAGIALACWLAALAILPLFNQAWHHFILARYLAPLAPPTFAAMGCLIVGLGQPASRARRLAVAALAILLIAYPLQRLDAFYADASVTGRSNARLRQLVGALAAAATDAHPVYLDRELRHLRLTAGGNVLAALDSILDVLDAPHVKVKKSEQPELPAGALIVLSQEQVDALGQDRRLDPLDLGAPLAPASPGEYGVYRLGP